MFLFYNTLWFMNGSSVMHTPSLFFFFCISAPAALRSTQIPAAHCAYCSFSLEENELLCLLHVFLAWGLSNLRMFLHGEQTHTSQGLTSPVFVTANATQPHSHSVKLKCITTHYLTNCVWRGRGADDLCTRLLSERFHLPEDWQRFRPDPHVLFLQFLEERYLGSGFLLRWVWPWRCPSERRDRGGTSTQHTQRGAYS